MKNNEKIFFSENFVSPRTTKIAKNQQILIQFCLHCSKMSNGDIKDDIKQQNNDNDE